MARQTGKTKLEGRVGDVIYYKLNGKYYARAVSSLSRKRVKRDPKFKRTMEFAGIFAVASKLASEMYRSLPHGTSDYREYRKMTGFANQLLKAGMEKEQVAIELRNKFTPGTRRKVNRRRMSEEKTGTVPVSQAPAMVVYCSPQEMGVKIWRSKKENEKKKVEKTDYAVVAGDPGKFSKQEFEHNAIVEQEDISETVPDIDTKYMPLLLHMPVQGKKINVLPTSNLSLELNLSSHQHQHTPCAYRAADTHHPDHIHISTGRLGHSVECAIPAFV